MLLNWVAHPLKLRSKLFTENEDLMNVEHGNLLYLKKVEMGVISPAWAHLVVVPLEEPEPVTNVLAVELVPKDLK